MPIGLLKPDTSSALDEMKWVHDELGKETHFFTISAFRYTPLLWIQWLKNTHTEQTDKQTTATTTNKQNKTKSKKIKFLETCSGFAFRLILISHILRFEPFVLAWFSCFWNVSALTTEFVGRCGHAITTCSTLHWKPWFSAAVSVCAQQALPLHSPTS